MMNSERMVRSEKLVIRESTPCKLKKSFSINENGMLRKSKIEEFKSENKQLG